MESPRKAEVLPGVEQRAVPPDVVFHSVPVVRHARRKALLTDGINVLLIATLDVLFAHFPNMGVPGLTRSGSLSTLIAANVLLGAYVWLSRAIPRWKARRVSSTWSQSERSRMKPAVSTPGHHDLQ